MLRRKHLLAPLIVALVLTGGGATALLLAEEPRAFPTDEEIARNGFAAWPVDTPEEAREECATAEDWRRDPEQVVLRFASEVLRYPDPTIGNEFTGGDQDTYRTLINSRGVKGIFLGAVVEVDRFGECWYVTEGQPREGDMGIDIATFDGGARVLVPVGCCGTVVEIGWGDWTYRLDEDDRTNETGEVLVDVPDEARGRPGHFIVTDFDRDGVSEGVGARPLPPLPTSEGATPLSPIDIGRRPQDRNLCRMAWARKGDPERTIRELRNWTFRTWLGTDRGGYSRYDVSSVRGLGSDFEWRVRLDEATLRFSFSRVARRCWAIRSIVPRRGPLIESVSAAGDRSFTFDLDPGQATKLVVYYGVGGEAQPVSIRTKALLGQPFSVSRGPDFVDRNEGLPAFALVIAYRYGNLHSAEYRLFQMPESQP